MTKIAGSGGFLAGQLVGYSLSVSERPVFTDLSVSAGDTIQFRRDSRQLSVCLGGIARKTCLTAPLYLSIF